METRTEAKVTRLKTAVATFAIALLIAACSAGVAENGGIHMDAPETTIEATEDHGGMDMGEEAHEEEAADAHDEEGEEAHGDEMDMETFEVAISLTEFGMSPATITVEEGDMITFVVTNDGVAPHEFEVTGAEDREGHEHEAGHGEASESKLVLGPGETGEITVMFDGSQDEIVCLIPGHYEAGMLLQINYGGSYAPTVILP
jgi:plastocyanin